MKRMFIGRVLRSGRRTCMRALVCLFTVLLLPYSLSGCGKEGASDRSSSAEEPIVVTTAADVTQATETTASAESMRKTVHFVGVGDNLIHPNLYTFADLKAGEPEDGRYDFTIFFEHIKDEIAGADLAFINQETLSGGDELGLRGYPNFNTPRAIIPQLEELGFDLVGMANNHVLDNGIQGIYHALYRWAQTDCVICGINADEEMREAIPLIERNGVTFAFLAYTSHTNGIHADVPWRVNYMNAEEIRRDVTKAKELADFVIVSAHWGWDDVFEIDGYQREYAQLFADTGVDLVIGTGPHLLQHIEWYDREDGGKMLCAFSLGNYASGMLGPFNELAGMLTLDFVIDPDGGKRVENVVLVPTVMHKEPSEEVMAVYHLRDYTDELAAVSSVNHYRGGLTLDYLYRVLHEQIAPEFLPEEYRQRGE